MMKFKYTYYSYITNYYSVHSSDEPITMRTLDPVKFSDDASPLNTLFGQDIGQAALGNNVSRK